MKKVLVTGGAGFIGSNFVHYLLKNHDDVFIVNLDALTYAGSLENLKDLSAPERHFFVQGQITDRELIDRLFAEHKIDTVIHFAAESHVDRSILNPGVFVDTNVVGTFVLLEAARRAWLVDKIVPLEQCRFHHVSTDEVFGTLTPEDPPFQEDTPYAPRSPYAASKAASDHFVRAYAETYGLPISISNCTNNYGPRQFPEKLIPLMILNAVSGKPLPIYGDGMQIRDWLYVDDHCGHLDGRPGRPGETYCIGGITNPQTLKSLKRFAVFWISSCQIQSLHLTNNSLHMLLTGGRDRRYDITIDKINSNSLRPTTTCIEAGGYH